MNRDRPVQVLDEETTALSLFLEAMFREPLPAQEAAVQTIHSTEASTTVPAPVPVSCANEVGETAVEPDSFDAMLVDVGVLRLVLPLVDLGAVIVLPEELTEMPGQAPWVIGVIQSHAGNTVVVDTCSLVAPENQRDQKPAYRHVVLIGDGRWGLACVSVSDVFRVEPGELRRRAQRRRRSWLAGTLVDYLSGLLDVPEFVSCLENNRFV